MSSIRTLCGIGVVLSGLALGACTPTVRTPPARAISPIDQHRVAPVVGVKEVFFMPHPDGLSDAQRSAAYQVIEEWRRSGSGPITVETPASAPDDSFLATAHLDNFLQYYGVPEAQLAFRRSQAAAAAPIRVSFTSYSLVIPRCGENWPDFRQSSPNLASPNFGCAVAANLAVMTANPAVLAAPRAMDPPDAGRREAVLQKYRSGEVTSTARDEQASATISDVVQ